MSEWLFTFEPFEKVYWSVALIASVIFIILLILTFAGRGFDDSGNVGSDSDTGIHFQFLSFKNLMGFLTVFSWTGIACIQEGQTKAMTLMISTICGLLMMFIMASLFYFLGKLDTTH